MKRLIVTAIACGVWLSAISSAAALTYVLDRPATPSTTGFADAPICRASEIEMRSAAFDTPWVGVVQPVVRITAPPLVRPTQLARPTQPPRDIDEMSCASPRELDMGSGRVQICE